MHLNHKLIKLTKGWVIVITVKNKALAVIVSLLLSGCNTLSPANAQPTVPPATSHVISFNVNQHVQAHLSLQETRIMLQTRDLPAVQVSSANVPLLRQWESIYFKINDYDRDGLNDLAILQSVGRVGTQRCYAVYRYNPATGRFRQHKSFDRCGI